MSTYKVNPEDVDAMIDMRMAGHSYRDIGIKFGVSHETARATLLASDVDLPNHVRTTKREQRQAEVDEFTAWLVANGPVTRDAIKEKFGYTSKQIGHFVRAGAPGYLIMTADRVTNPVVSDDDVMASLRRTWEALQKIDPGAEGLSNKAYNTLRDPERDLSAARITGRYGWAEACEKAGVPSGSRFRPKNTYTRRFSEKHMLDAVGKYAAECRKTQKRATYIGYDKWQRKHAGLPSGTLVRLRLAESGYTTWSEIVLAASHSMGE